MRSVPQKLSRNILFSFAILVVIVAVAFWRLHTHAEHLKRLSISLAIETRHDAQLRKASNTLLATLATIAMLPKHDTEGAQDATEFAVGFDRLATDYRDGSTLLSDAIDKYVRLSGERLPNIDDLLANMQVLQQSASHAAMYMKMASELPAMSNYYSPIIEDAVNTVERHAKLVAKTGQLYANILIARDRAMEKAIQATKLRYNRTKSETWLQALQSP